MKSIAQIKALKSPESRYKAASEAETQTEVRLDELRMIRAEAIAEMRARKVPVKAIKEITGLSATRIHDLVKRVEI